MAEDFKVVKSPIITDTELPQDEPYNGLANPYLDETDFSGNGPWVLKIGDTMTGTLVITISDLEQSTVDLRSTSGNFEVTQTGNVLLNYLMPQTSAQTPTGSVISNLTIDTLLPDSTVEHVFYDIKFTDIGS